MTLRTITFDDSTHKLVPREPTDEMILAVPSAKILHQTHDLIASEYKVMIASAPEYQEPAKDEQC